MIYQSKYHPLLSFIIDEKFDLSQSHRVLEGYWSTHPKFRFFKDSPPDAKFLDIGCGNCGIHFWKTWGLPIRNDVSLYGIDLFRGEHASKFVEVHVVNLDENKLPFPANFFDAVNVSHVVEHLRSLPGFLKTINGVTKLGGRVYVEYPHPDTVAYPSMKQVAEEGIRCGTLRFDDDNTHIEAYSPEKFRKMAEDIGFSIVREGRLSFPEYENDLMSMGFCKSDPGITTMAFWSRLRWAQYFLLEKVS